MLESNSLNTILTLDSRIYGLARTTAIDKVAVAVSRSAHEITFDVLTHEAEKLARMVKEEINTQRPDWPPLNADYKDWKERIGLNTDMLKATEAYYDSISVQEIRNAAGQFASVSSVLQSPSEFTIRVGVPFRKHPGLSEEEGSNEKGIRYDQLATILEFGTDVIPARPHWMPAYQRWRAQHARSIRARIMSLAVRKFKKDFKAALTPRSQARRLPRS